MKLVSVARKVILVIGTICFISMVTGVTLQLHLKICKHAEKHDYESCKICTSLLVESPKFLRSLETQVVCTEYIISDPIHPFYSILQPIQLKAFDPRPPPVSWRLVITFSRNFKHSL